MKNFLGSALFLTLIIAGCEEKQPDPANTLTAKAGGDQNVKVGDNVALDGSTSVDKDNKPFDYRWAFTKKPTGSTINLNAANTSKPTFTPDLPGEYEAELTISNANGESKDKVLITASVIQPIALEAEIKTNLVLEDRVNNPDIPDYVANQNVLVNAELTLKPGVVIAFARDARLEVNDGKGILIAKGDSVKRIRLIGKEATKGFWAGVVIRSASSANALEYADVLHTGSKPLTNVIKAGMLVIGGSKAQISIKNSLFLRKIMVSGCMRNMAQYWQNLQKTLSGKMRRRGFRLMQTTLPSWISIRFLRVEMVEMLWRFLLRRCPGGQIKKLYGKGLRTKRHTASWNPLPLMPG